MSKELRLSSLADALRELDALEKVIAAARPEGPWSLAHILHHVAASIEYSLGGYPEYRSAFVRAVIGPLVLRFFLARGVLTHGHAEEIAGAPPPPDDDVASALGRLRKAIADFGASTAEPVEHFVYGRVTRAEYDRIHAMHLADHLCGVAY